MAHTITTEHVVKRYGSVAAVDDVSLAVGEGEFFGILGPNGAGKTTLVEMMEGLRQPDSGTITLLGQPVWPRNTALLGRMGVQLQGSAFFERLTAREQLATFGSLYGMPAARVDEMLELVGLTDKASTRAEKLSGGQAQRLSIACSLVHDPDVVFLDEPSAALDPQARRNLWDVLRAINERGKTVVLTTHYMDEAEILCDRVAIMDGGKVLQLGPPADLVRDLDAPVRISVEAAALGQQQAAGLEGVESVSGDTGSTVISTRRPAPVLQALAGMDALAGLQVRGATLEDVFLQLTGREYRA
ncbi:ABC transporter ATP-binding protein [Nakamurella multipartita]|uniref:ABC transporter related n=1 Tax=Nakamurella multipartita (strain ATCC 700099 / DSM 44233 / CIP 104796 / JCM 9543 / NBRC 105858 / Y-104) TaxID=479431 RepID=C8XBT1_NAKMY|nr:ABC transporter ATP-binding protein [Nakamurella multipartita]ACV79435.1 ABC transporter related [Nakamurella multipartita DSM 44233]